MAGDFHDNLKFATWDKKKGSLLAGHDVGDKLKSLQRRHDAVDWKAFDPGWAKAAKTVQALDDAFAQRDRVYRSAVFALKKDANELAQAAQRMGKAKDAGKPTQEAVKAIVAAVNEYAKAIDAGADALAQAADAARKALPDPADDADEGAASALLDPKKLLQQMQACARDPARRAQYALVDGIDKEKKPPVLAMHPKTTGKSMFAKLQEQTGVKAGSYGVAWIDAKTLNLRMDKAFGSLPKKVRVALKASGFRVSQIVLWSADGKEVERDSDADEAQPGKPAAEAQTAEVETEDDAGTGSPVQEPVVDEVEFARRLKAALAGIATAGPLAAQIKLLTGEAAALARQRRLGPASATLAEAEALLAGGTSGGTSGGTAKDTPTGKATTATDAQAKAAPAAMVYRQTQLVWNGTRDKVRAELQRLEAAIVATYAGELVLPTVQTAVRQLDRVLLNFDTSLADKLEEAATAADPTQRALLHGQARDIIGRYRGFLGSDALVRQLDNNPFVPVGVEATLKKSLDLLAAKIA
jgi:hypothetical protein